VGWLEMQRQGPSGIAAMRRVCRCGQFARCRCYWALEPEQLESGEVVVSAGVRALRSGQKVRLVDDKAMTRLNLSAWAIGHRSIGYCPMLALVAARALLINGAVGD
jgi:hypothetical protein